MPGVRSQTPPAFFRIGPIILAAASLLLAIGAALVRLGWDVPVPNYDYLIAHGPMMVCGFLGTVICLERAIALNRAWGFAFPWILGSAGVWQAFYPSGQEPLALFILGSVGLLGIFAVFLRKHPSFHTAVEALAVLMWVVGNGLRWAGWPLFAVVPWWLCFLVLTIAGERLELSRLLGPSRSVRALFIVSVSTSALGACLSALGFAMGRGKTDIISTEWGDLFTDPLYGAGVRCLGAGFALLALWCLRNDIARKSLRVPGLSRYMAICLIVGYVWLLIAGVLGLAGGGYTGGMVFDAMLHTVFIGFVFSMIFAHAPVILPAVAGISFPFTRILYLPLVLLHASLALRIGSDLTFWYVGRAWGGMLNGVAILVFVLSVLITITVIRRLRPESS